MRMDRGKQEDEQVKQTKFLVGAATAAHQVEGNNKKSDYWAMEQLPGSNFSEPSLDAADHYHRYKEDLQLLADTGANAYRFSIEWARIEPQKGVYDETEIAHYREVLLTCHQLNLTPIVTLHHFTSPKWLITEGGWEAQTTIAYFRQYAQLIAERLGDLITYVCTINEANMGKQIRKLIEGMQAAAQQAPEAATEEKTADLQIGLNELQASDERAIFNQGLAGSFEIAPDKIQTFLAPRSEAGEAIIMACHQAAREAFKAIHPETQVGITFSLYDHQALPGAEALAEAGQQADFLDYLPYLEADDFLGVQNYTRKIHALPGQAVPEEPTRMTKMGYEFYPEALGNVLQAVAKQWHKPILVTENGVATDNDAERIEFMARAIEGVAQAKAAGVPVIGYCYWSLLDNFEWQLGYAQTFGLIAVDRKTQTRYPKESLAYLHQIVEKMQNS